MKEQGSNKKYDPNGTPMLLSFYDPESDVVTVSFAYQGEGVKVVTPMPIAKFINCKRLSIGQRDFIVQNIEDALKSIVYYDQGE